MWGAFLLISLWRVFECIRPSTWETTTSVASTASTTSPYARCTLYARMPLKKHSLCGYTPLLVILVYRLLCLFFLTWWLISCLVVKSWFNSLPSATSWHGVANQANTVSVQSLTRFFRYFFGLCVAPDGQWAAEGARWPQVQGRSTLYSDSPTYLRMCLHANLLGHR